MFQSSSLPKLVWCVAVSLRDCQRKLAKLTASLACIVLLISFNLVALFLFVSVYYIQILTAEIFPKHLTHLQKYTCFCSALQEKGISVNIRDKCLKFLFKSLSTRKRFTFAKACWCFRNTRKSNVLGNLNKNVHKG